MWGHACTLIDTPLVNEPSAGVIPSGEYTLEGYSLLLAVLLRQEQLHLHGCIFGSSQHNERAQVIRTAQKLENKPHTKNPFCTDSARGCAELSSHTCLLMGSPTLCVTRPIDGTVTHPACGYRNPFGFCIGLSMRSRSINLSPVCSMFTPYI